MIDVLQPLNLLKVIGEIITSVNLVETRGETRLPLTRLTGHVMTSRKFDRKFDRSRRDPINKKEEKDILEPNFQVDLKEKKWEKVMTFPVLFLEIVLKKIKKKKKSHDFIISWYFSNQKGGNGERGV